MNNEQKKSVIEQYVNKVVDDANSRYSNLISDELRKKALEKYLNSPESYEDIVAEIDRILENMINHRIEVMRKIIELDSELRRIKKESIINQEKIFGETYKSSLIEIFEIFDQIDSYTIDDSKKEQVFSRLLNEYLISKKEDLLNYLKQQTDNQELVNYGMKSLFLGYESLDYEIVKNLNSIFKNDLNLIQCEVEGKMKMTVPNNQNIFDVDGNLNSNLTYDFSRIKTIYDYAKKNSKQIKHHELLWHNSVPENLRNELNRVTDPLKKRKMTLSFLDHYYSELAKFFKQNNYDVRQIDALNEIASDKPNGDILRDSFWKDAIGDNPYTKDKYFIDVLKLQKKHFPSIELIYNDYNEFYDYKRGKICAIMNYIKQVEKRDGIKLIDGLGLQSHYHDYLPRLKRNLTPEDIKLSALEFIKLDVPLYITEFDFNNEKKSDISGLTDTFIDVYSVAANGFVSWGNSDQLTWPHCLGKNGEYLNSHIVDSRGNKKQIFNQIKESFRIKKSNNISNVNLQENVKEININNSNKFDDSFFEKKTERTTKK